MPCTVQQGTHVGLVSPGHIDYQHTCVTGNKMSVFAVASGENGIFYRNINSKADGRDWLAAKQTLL